MWKIVTLRHYSWSTTAKKFPFLPASGMGNFYSVFVTLFFCHRFFIEYDKRVCFELKLSADWLSAAR